MQLFRFTLDQQDSNCSTIGCEARTLLQKAVEEQLSLQHSTKYLKFSSPCASQFIYVIRYWRMNYLGYIGACQVVETLNGSSARTRESPTKVIRRLHILVITQRGYSIFASLNYLPITDQHSGWTPSLRICRLDSVGIFPIPAKTVK